MHWGNQLKRIRKVWNNHEYCNTSDLGLKINMACALGMPSLNVLQQGANWSSAQIRRVESVPKKKTATDCVGVSVDSSLR